MCSSYAVSGMTAMAKWGVSATLTCDDETLVVVQGFGEEARHDELGVDHEPDLLLDQPIARDPASHHPVGKVHLWPKHRFGSAGGAVPHMGASIYSCIFCTQLLL